MSIRLTTFIALLPVFMLGQLSFFDDFSDSNFTVNPTWMVDTGIFEISSDKRLKLNDTIANQAQIFATSEISIDAQWDFEAELQFNPSSSNYAEVYLIADSSDFRNAPNAVFVRLGGSTSDRLSLFLRTAGNNNLLLESTDGMVGKATNTIKVRITRSTTDVWELFADTTTGFTNLTSIGTDTNTTVLFSKYTGVRCVYTKTRSDKMLFDNFSYAGDFFSDTIPPKVIKLSVISPTEIKIDFNEGLNKSIAENANNYSFATTAAQVIDAEIDASSSSSVLLELNPPLQNRNNYSLSLSKVADKEGNPLKDTTLNFSYFLPSSGDVVINELLPDPNPVIGIPPNALPSGEYIELYNRSDFDINLLDWKLSAGSSTVTLSDKLLPAKGYLIIARASIEAELPASVNFLAASLSTTALTNGGALVRLTTPDDLKIDEVLYSASWYGDPNKDDGGWSLERIDPDNLCGGKENWLASVNPIGGTPGTQNSVFGQTQDTTAPRVTRLAVDGDSIVYVYLSEWLDDLLLQDVFAYTIEPALQIARIRPNRLAQRLELVLTSPLQIGEIYTLTYLGFSSDCAGNPLRFDELIFGLADVAEKGKVFINEVLFNPYTNGADYVELYNSSDKLIDLEKMRLSSYINGTTALSDVKEITTESFLVAPNSYVCLTENPDGVKAFYTIKNPNALVDAIDLPTMDDDEGSIILLNANLSVVDSLVYTEELHSPALVDEEGVSLERASYEANLPVATMWYSASSVAGFGTPGYENSQQNLNRTIPQNKLEIKNILFSPNNDGYQDKLEIGVSFDKPNFVVSITIYNKEGYELNKVVDNAIINKQTTFVWDGTNQNGQSLSKGAYLVVLEYFHTDGETGTEKKAVVLTY